LDGAFAHWGIGALDIGALGHWGIGALGHWGIGALGHWAIGALGHWGIGHWAWGGHGALVVGAPALAKPWVGTAGKPPSVTTHTMAASIHVTSVAILERMLVSDRKASLLMT